MTITSMVLFDANGCLKHYNSIDEILLEFFVIRLEFYVKRKNYLVGILQAETTKLKNQISFIFENCKNILNRDHKKSEDLINELRLRRYEPDPVKVWMLAQDKEAVLEEVAEQNHDQEERKKQVAKETLKEDFNYLLDMPRRSLTGERHDELLKLRDAKETELNILRKKLPSQLWREDLNNFLEALRAEEKTEGTQNNRNTVETKKTLSPDIEVVNDTFDPEGDGESVDQEKSVLERVGLAPNESVKGKSRRVSHTKDLKALTKNSKSGQKSGQCPDLDIGGEKDKVDQEKSVLECVGLAPNESVKGKSRRVSHIKALKALTKNSKSGQKKAGNDHDDDDHECHADKCLEPTGMRINWVQCDGECGLWFHLRCVGLRPEDLKKDKDYYCKRCSTKDQSTSTADDDLQADV